MDTNKLLRDAGINDPAAFQFAATLRKQGQSSDQILQAVQKEFEIEDKLEMRPGPADFNIFGEIGVDVPHGALDQMQTVMRIPPAITGALMPDAHHGYALPIGGVVVLDNAVSPSFVGYDIACRMMVSILDITPQEFLKNRQKIFSDMQTVSRFGVGSEFTRSGAREHEVMDDYLWRHLPHLEKLRNTAIRQLGSSGGGNHFFDALIGEVVTPSHHLTVDGELQYLPEGALFVAIMTHSGSRGAGHKSATHYLKLAKKETEARARGIPKGYEWLSLDTQAGQEYWSVMQLMGLYAQANHQLIHAHFSKESGISRIIQHENHHNFAWLGDNMSVTHRKGATPAHIGQVGIIPGSSGTPSYLVEGLGNPMSLYSSSHGAGRPFSRKEAKSRHSPDLYSAHMQVKDILTDGVAPDETFMAYKDIERVIQLQDGLLVKVLAKMYPKIVIMGGKR
jgi:tRNA-splicing ligase RtcB